MYGRTLSLQYRRLTWTVDLYFSYSCEVTNWSCYRYKFSRWQMITVYISIWISRSSNWISDNTVWWSITCSVLQLYTQSANQMFTCAYNEQKNSWCKIEAMVVYSKIENGGLRVPGEAAVIVWAPRQWWSVQAGDVSNEINSPGTTKRAYPSADRLIHFLSIYKNLIFIECDYCFWVFGSLKCVFEGFSPFVDYLHTKVHSAN